MTKKDTGCAEQVEVLRVFKEERCLDVEPEVLFCCKRKLKQTLKINSSSAQAVDVAILANVRVLLPIIPVLFVSSSLLSVVGGPIVFVD